MQTTVIFKTDKKLKEVAQNTAKKMGIPFSAVLNNFMREFVARQEVTFSTESYNATPYLAQILREGEKNLAEGKVTYYNNLEDMRTALDN